MKRWVISTLLLGSAVMAKSTHQPLKSMLLNNDRTINVNLKETGSTFYTVRAGDTIASVASDHHITISKLKKTNTLSSKQVLTAGSKLKIPDQSIPLSQILALVNSAGPTLKEARKHLGKKYVWAANGPKTFDCSGFTSYVYRKMGIKIPRVSKNQGKVGLKVARKELRKGDLVFFDTSRRRRGYINHVGIYIGNHKFIHASSSRRRVIISNLDKKFYKARFKWGRRVK